MASQTIYLPPSSGGSQTIDQVLTTGNITTRGYFVNKNVAVPKFSSVYIGPRLTPADGSGQIQLSDVPDGLGVTHNYLSLAASNTTTASSIHMSSGDQNVGPTNDVICTTLNTDTATSAVVSVGDMHNNKIRIYPASIVITDATNSSSNTITLVNKVLGGSQTASFPSTTGIIGVARYSRLTAQTTAVSGVGSTTVGAVDASYVVSCNILVTASTTHSFTAVVNYTDEGNTARAATFNFSIVAGTLSTLVTNAGGTVPYMGVPLHIRCKAATGISISTVAGTFTSVTYNIEAQITQVG